MRARSVVVGSLSKFDGQETRFADAQQYRQLTGRAGSAALTHMARLLFPTRRGAI
jgi:superfamily II RNA helicase